MKDELLYTLSAYGAVLGMGVLVVGLRVLFDSVKAEHARRMDLVRRGTAKKVQP